MTPEKLKEAEFEAKRFLKRLDELKKVKDDAQHYSRCNRERAPEASPSLP